MIKRLLAVCALRSRAVVGVSASAALAGEVKGPPYQGRPVSGGIVDETNATGAAAHAKSLCAFSGLNDYDSDSGDPEAVPQLDPLSYRPGPISASGLRRRPAGRCASSTRRVIATAMFGLHSEHASCISKRSRRRDRVSGQSWR